jgi:hypothetical protein
MKITEVINDYPIDYVVGNYMQNTQPDKILKYPCVWNGMFNGKDFKVFRLNKGVKSLLFRSVYMKDVRHKIEIKQKNKPYQSSHKLYKVNMMLPDLLFTVETRNYDEKYNLYVHGIHGNFASKKMNIFHAPLPNLYTTGSVCQSDKISIIKHVDKNHSYKMANSYDICEYYIDEFLKSVFNDDLNGYWENAVVQEMGFASISDFLDKATDPMYYDYVSYKYNITKNKDALNNFFKGKISKSNKITTDFCRQINVKGHDPFIPVYSPTNYLKIRDFEIEENDFIFYKDLKLKVISFGPEVSSYKLYKNIPEDMYTDGMYIKCIDIKHNKIITIPFSELCNVKDSPYILIEKYGEPNSDLLKRKYNIPYGISCRHFYNGMRIKELWYQVENKKYKIRIFNPSDELKDIIFSNIINAYLVLDTDIIENMPFFNFETDFYPITEINNKIMFIDSSIKLSKFDIMNNIMAYSGNDIIIDNNTYFSSIRDLYIKSVSLTKYQIPKNDLLLHRELSIYKCDVEHITLNDKIIIDTANKSNSEDDFIDSNFINLNLKIQEFNKEGKINEEITIYDDLYDTYENFTLIFELNKYYRIPLIHEKMYMEPYKATNFSIVENEIVVLFKNDNGNEIHIPLYFIAKYQYDNYYFFQCDTRDHPLIGKKIFIEAIQKNDFVYDKIGYEIVDIDTVTYSAMNKLFLSTGLVICYEKNCNLSEFCELLPPDTSIDYSYTKGIYAIKRILYNTTNKINKFAYIKIRNEQIDIPSSKMNEITI